jgi:co-chaperonin GroES (HSP10)
MIRPHDYSIVVRPETQSKTTESGLIYIPDVSKSPMLYGEVLMVGDEINSDETVLVGETVYFLKGKYVSDDDGNVIISVSAVIDFSGKKIVVTD